MAEPGHRRVEDGDSACVDSGHGICVDGASVSLLLSLVVPGSVAAQDAALCWGSVGRAAAQGLELRLAGHRDPVQGMFLLDAQGWGRTASVLCPHAIISPSKGP